MPSGTAKTAAMMKPPSTRQTVTPISPAKPYSVNSETPASAAFSGSARNSGGTMPPSVTAAQAAMNSTKNRIPRTVRRPGETGLRGSNTKNPRCLLEEAGVNHRLEVGDLLDHAGQLGRASCRERVCPYVSISVVAVSLKKKIYKQPPNSSTG